MLEKFLQLLQEQDSLVREARLRAVGMLKTTHEMFDSVVHAVTEGPGRGLRHRVADIDKEVNRQQREVRKMVFEHLAVSSGRDLLESLRLVTVVIDIERIGDLSKNIEELFEMMPRGRCLEGVDSPFTEIEELALAVFNDTEQAFENNDEEAARRAIFSYDRVSALTEEHFRNVLSATSDDDRVRRADLAMVLLLRYVRRTCGHLKNISSAVINPFDRIGFRDGID